MKVFIVAALEWLVLQTDNDLDDKLLAKVKSGMKLGVVWIFKLTLMQFKSSPYIVHGAIGMSPLSLMSNS